MAVKNRSADSDQPASIEKLASTAQTSGKTLKQRGGLDSKQDSPGTKANGRVLVRPPQTSGQKRDVQGRASSQRPTDVSRFTARGQDLKAGETTLVVRARPPFQSTSTGPPSKSRTGAISKRTTRQPFRSAVPPSNIRQRPGGGDQSHDAHSQKSLIDSAARTGVHNYSSLIAQGVLNDLTEAFTDSMNSRRRQTLLEDIERREQGIMLYFNNAVHIRFPLVVPTSYPTDSILDNFVSLYNERVGSAHPRMKHGYGSDTSNRDKWNMTAEHDYKDVDGDGDDQHLLKDDFIHFQIASPYFNLFSGTDNPSLWPKATSAVFKELTEYFRLSDCDDCGTIHLAHRDYNLRDYQRLTAAAFHFEEAIIELTGDSSDAVTNDVRGGWRHHPDLRHIQRPKIFERINATTSITELIQLIDQDKGGEILQLRYDETNQEHDLSLAPWPSWTSPAKGIQCVKWTAAFIVAATKISMANYRRFPPDLAGLKTFMFTGICGGAGVAPSPRMAEWWPEIAMVWPRVYNLPL